MKTRIVRFLLVGAVYCSCVFMASAMGMSIGKYLAAGDYMSVFILNGLSVAFLACLIGLAELFSHKPEEL